jgi:hypothetical protein
MSVVAVPTLHLFGGEMDGYRQQVEFLTRPDIFYAVPLLEMEDIKKLRNPASRQHAIKTRGRLAYKFWQVSATEEAIEYRYQRVPDMDPPQHKKDTERSAP